VGKVNSGVARSSTVRQGSGAKALPRNNTGVLTELHGREIGEGKSQTSGWTHPGVASPAWWRIENRDQVLETYVNNED
jgi:hypothetical protein